MSLIRIHPTAIVDPKAELDSSVTVGAYSIIGPDVVIGPNTTVGSHVTISHRTTIGADNRIFPYTVIGGEPQDKKYRNEPTQLIIGDRNTIREFASLHIGTVQDEGITSVGNDNWIMSYVHLAHDCRIGNHTIFANNSQLAGHVHVGDYAILGGFTTAHQFVKIGAHSMTAISTVLLQDLPPYVTAAGNVAQAVGINVEGLKRRGFSPEQIKLLRQAFKLIYRQNKTLVEAKQELSTMVESNPLATDSLSLLLDFLNVSTRGIVR